MWPGSLDFGTCSLPKFSERLTSSCPGRQSVSPHCNHRLTVSHLLLCINSKARECLQQTWQYREGRTCQENSSTCTSWNIWAGFSDEEGRLCSLLPAPSYWIAHEEPGFPSLLLQTDLSSRKSCREAVFHRIAPELQPDTFHKLDRQKSLNRSHVWTRNYYRADQSFMLFLLFF